MAGVARRPLQRDDDDHHHPSFQAKSEDVLLRLISLEPRELCSEAIIEKCRATRDLRSCGRTVEHALTSCNHASLCTECSQRCDVCPICRVSIRRHGPSMRLRLYEECLEAGLISAREEEFRERDGHLADVQRLWAFFDVALGNKLVSVICQYVSDVCMDDGAVSSNAIVSMLLDGTVVQEWCVKTFLQMIRSLQDIYALGTKQMQSKVGDLEKFATKLLGLSHVLESLEGPTSDATSAPLLELQQLVEGVQRVSQHVDVMCWCAKHHFLENIPSSHSTMSSWRTDVRGRKSAANNRAWPDHTRNAWETSSGNLATLFIEDAMAKVGFGKDKEDDFLRKNLELGCLRQATITSIASFKRREAAGVQSATAAVYPPESVRAAVDMIFLEASADLLLAKKAIFLYYLFDRQWPHCDGEWKLLLEDYMLTFDISRHAMLESLLFFLLDDSSDMALEEACCLLPEVVSYNIHPKVVRVLLERKKPDVALEVLHCSGGDGSLRLSGSVSESEIPPLPDAVTVVRVRLECGLLTEAYLYQRSYTLRVKAQGPKDLMPKIKCGSRGDCRDWPSEMELLVREICWLCIRKNLVDKMVELPWQEDEEKILLKCLLEQATQDPCSTAGSLMVVFYTMRCRNREAYLVHKRLCAIEKSFINKCGDAGKGDLVKSICAQRTNLVENFVELLPEIQQDQLRSGALDQLLPLSADLNKGGFIKLSDSVSMVPALPEEMRASLNAAPFTFNEKRELQLLSHKTTPDFIKPVGWGNYRQPSILHGKTLKSTSGGPDILSQLDLSTFSGVAPGEGLLSPILGRKSTYNMENDSTSFATRRPRTSVAQDAKGSTHYEKRNSQFLAPLDLSSADSQGLNIRPGPVPSSDNSELSLHEDDGTFFNERVQNGAPIVAENGSCTATSFFRQSENGSAEKRNLPGKDQQFDLPSREVFKHRPRRQMVHSSPNGKRKAYDQLAGCLLVVSPDLAGDTQHRLITNNQLKPSANEQQQGILFSEAETASSSHFQRKNGLRWRAEDDGMESPSLSVPGGRIKPLSSVGRATSGSRSFRSHAL